MKHKKDCNMHKVMKDNGCLFVINGNESLMIDGLGFKYKLDSQFSNCKIEVNFKYCPCCGVEMMGDELRDVQNN